LEQVLSIIIFFKSYFRFKYCFESKIYKIIDYWWIWLNSFCCYSSHNL